MKVSECKKCKHCERCVRTETYLPANYHLIGINHAYHVCKIYGGECLKIKGCDSKEASK